MKILFLHNKYLQGGGEDVSTQSEIDLLKDNGHHVDVFFAHNADLKGMNSLHIAANTIWSMKSYSNLTELIQGKAYDIIHVQNFFPQLSPSIFYAAKKNGVKIVMSVRNYRLICPNALMFVNNNNCQSCVGLKLPWPAISKKCYRDSLPATATVVAMLAIHNYLNTWASKIDGFIAISEFVKIQLVSAGFQDQKVFVKHNFVRNPPDFIPRPEDNSFVYLGRLSTEKGISNLLAAFQDDRLKHLKLKIIGDGPEEMLVNQAVKSSQNISYLGRLSINKAYEILGNSLALIFPSRWHEPFGRTVVESFSLGTPVIGASVGGVTELIKNGYNGLLYNSEDINDLVDKILELSIHENYNNLRIQARATFDSSFTAEQNYEKIITIYDKVLSKN